MYKDICSWGNIPGDNILGELPASYYIVFNIFILAERFYDKFSRFQESYRFEDLEKLHLLKRKQHLNSNNEYLNLFRYCSKLVQITNLCLILVGH